MGGVAGVVVVGQIGRDLVLRMEALPGPGGSVTATGRRELLGGKGANQAVALAQLGLGVALVGVVGDDDAGTAVRAQAAADGIDVSPVVMRPGGVTALLVDLVEDGGRRRLIEDVPDEVLLTPADVAAAEDRIAAADALVLQLQQPGPAVRTALAAAGPEALVVADGAPPDDESRAALLARLDVLRADGREAGHWVGREVSGADDARRAAAELLAEGPRIVALSAGADGDLVAWAGGQLVLPLLGEAPQDPTGAGDPYVAGLTAALLAGAAPEQAAWEASAAAALTVAGLGGRPALSRDRVVGVVHRERGPGPRG